MKYLKEAFDPITFEQAKATVLTPDINNPNKFEQETKFLIDVIQEQNIITSDCNVLDFGCGMGRVSKMLVDRFNCNVTGVDISERMKTFAMLYVSNLKKFTTTNTIEPNTFDVCLSILVLQHTENPELEIEKIYNGLKQDGVFIVVNEPHRLVPVDVDSDRFVIWNDDKFDIFSHIEKYFTKICQVPYKPNNDISINFYKKHV
jgi:SAM-dependent methyltransferase